MGSIGGAGAGLQGRGASFTSATERVREATYEMMRLPTTRLAARYEHMLVAIARALVPKRPGRSYPGAVKIKMSCYPLKRRRRRASWSPWHWGQAVPENSW